MSRGRVRIEDGQKRVRAYLDGEAIADSTAVKLVWEKPYYPVYYFPEADVRIERLIASDHLERSPSRGTVQFFDVQGGRRSIERAAYRHPESPVEALRGLVAFRWDAMDAWFEEDEEVFVHARDPYTRVDVLASSRHVRVEVAGVTIADSRNGRFLFETGLPVRRYLPKTDVRMDLLRPTETVTRCPYKGTAEYWSVVVGDEVFEDLAWSYPAPLLESVKIAGLISFYDEKVDVYVDGELQPRPKTVFSAGTASGAGTA